MNKVKKSNPITCCEKYSSVKRSCGGGLNSRTGFGLLPRCFLSTLETLGALRTLGVLGVLGTLGALRTLGVLGVLGNVACLIRGSFSLERLIHIHYLRIFEIPFDPFNNRILLICIICYCVHALYTVIIKPRRK